MILNEYYICDNNGYVVEKVNAHTLLNITQPDGNRIWTLKFVDGKDSHRSEGPSETFCHHSCWVDPDAGFNDKVKKGCEVEFEFFMKTGIICPEIKRIDYDQR